jgi:hypothetical protein
MVGRGQHSGGGNRGLLAGFGLIENQNIGSAMPEFESQRHADDAGAGDDDVGGLHGFDFKTPDQPFSNRLHPTRHGKPKSKPSN